MNKYWGVTQLAAQGHHNLHHICHQKLESYLCMLSPTLEGVWNNWRAAWQNMLCWNDVALVWFAALLLDQRVGNGGNGSNILGNYKILVTQASHCVKMIVPWLFSWCTHLINKYSVPEGHPSHCSFGITASSYFPWSIWYEFLQWALRGMSSYA